MNKKIKQMINFFDNETEHGKLYINYPMIESYKHFKNLVMIIINIIGYIPFY